MKAELQDKLFEKYPKIFGQKDLPMNQTCMCWGIDTPDSWYYLLDCLCDSIQAWVDQVGYENGKKIEHPQIQATQVKEKFGGLRFYLNGYTDAVDGMISMAYKLSISTCAICGSTKDVKSTEGCWIIYLCPKCMKQEIKNQ